jgi:hypothetical protein
MSSLPTSHIVISDVEDVEDIRYARMVEAVTRLDLPDTAIMALERAIEKVEDSPLLHLAEAWSATPLWDWDRPQVSPSTCEALGRWMATHLARVMRARLDVLATDVNF